MGGIKHWMKYQEGLIRGALGGGKPLPGGWTAHDKEKNKLVPGTPEMREFRKDKYKFYNPDVKETYWDQEKDLIKAGVDPKLVKEKEKKAGKTRTTKQSKTPLTQQKVLMVRQEGNGQSIKKTLMG